MLIFNNKGLSSIAAALTLLVLAAFGAVISYMVASSSFNESRLVNSTQAFYVTQAGIEYGIKRIYDQQNEIVNPPGLTFGPGSFTISRSGSTLTVTGTVGDAVRVYHVDSPTQADCTTIDTSNIQLTQSDKRIGGVTFRKICLTSITVDKMQASWVTNSGEKLKEIKIESNVVYTSPVGVSSGTLVEITDYTVVNGNNNIINWLEFDKSMEDKTVTLSLIMGDGTTKSATFVAD